MSSNDEAARKARAQQIRKQIKRLKTPPAKVEEQKEEGSPSRPKSYREPIHERMHEVDKKRTRRKGVSLEGNLFVLVT